MICTNDLTIKSDIEAILGLDDKKFTSTLIQTKSEAAWFKDMVPGILGMLGHLTCIEQFGNLFAPKSVARETTVTNRFKRCLYDFSSMTKPEIDALYGFRNGLVHDSSFCNINRQIDSGRNDYAYLFRPTWNAPHGIVELPAIDWKGDFSIFDSSRQKDLERSTTKINVTELPNLLDTILQNVIGLHNVSGLNCLVDPTSPTHELMARFALLIRTKP